MAYTYDFENIGGVKDGTTRNFSIIHNCLLRTADDRARPGKIFSDKKYKLNGSRNYHMAGTNDKREC